MYIYQSNLLENLLQQLLAVCTDTPPADPFTQEVIVVQHAGMAQWLSQQWAMHMGIATLLVFPLPARAIGQLYDRIAGIKKEEDLWRTPVLRWRIQRHLPDLTSHPAFASLAAYLKDDLLGDKLYQLAGRVASVFDQYLVYRTDMLLAWEDMADEENWQTLLWRRLANEEPRHRAQHLLQLKGLLAEPLGHGMLPERLHLFGINSLAPVYLDIFARMSQQSEVHLYQLSPCRTDWFDLVPAKKQAQSEAADALLAFSSPLQSRKNDLLAGLGRAGQVFLQQLLNYEFYDILVDLHEKSPKNTLLGWLQNQILNLYDPDLDGVELVQRDDRSIQIHSCSSPLREIQVLHDVLLDCFQNFPELCPGDILVAAPNISAYAAPISAVFGEATAAHRIPWSLADQPFSQEEPLVRVFLALLNLFDSRLTSSEVMAILEHPAVHQRFGLDKSQISRLYFLVDQAGIRFGLHAQHKKELGLQAADTEYSWQQGLDRLLLGYAMGPLEVFHCGLLPCGFPGTAENDLLGALATFLTRLDKWQSLWRQTQRPTAWAQLLPELINDWFDPSFEEEGLGLLHQQVQSFAREWELARFEGEISAQVISLHLQEALTREGSTQAFLLGRVTFCNMVPMRSLPFRVIYLLGMNDGEFPRSQHPVSFDLMPQKPRLGDRSRRDDDRYLFLESILSSRDLLAISFIGQDQRDGASLPPSVVVSEFMEYLDSAFSLKDYKAKISEQLLTRHPLQPFSPDNYRDELGPPSFNRSWLPATTEAPVLFYQKELFLEDASANDVADTTIALPDLLSFWRHPARYFLGTRLGMSLGLQETDPTEEEPFALDALQNYLLAEDIISRSLEEQPKEHIVQVLRGQGRLPSGQFGAYALSSIQERTQAFTAVLQNLSAEPRPARRVAIHLGETLLTGWLHHLFAGGRILWRAGQLTPPFFLDAWICHLVLCAISADETPKMTQILTWEGGAVKHQSFTMVDNAQSLLTDLMLAYQEGQRMALPFFPKSSFAWAKTFLQKKEQALYEAQLAWQGDSFYKQGEKNEEAHVFLFPQESPFDKQFEQLASLLLPALKALQVLQKEN